MARKDILPSYLSQQAWRDLCDAIDVVFKLKVDDPTNTLGKLRRPWNFTDAGKAFIEAGTLVPQSELEVFESNIQVKQVNAAGLLITDSNSFESVVRARFFRHLPRFWYSKGTQSVADFLSFVLGTKTTMKRLWTNDYVTFLPEGDPGIGAKLTAGGTWYPTTHTQVEIDSITLPPAVTPEIFARMFESICNYPLVLQFYITASDVWVSTTSGQYIVLQFVGATTEQETLCNFAIGAPELTPEQGEGGFTAIAPVNMAGPGGTGYSAPALPVADFTGSPLSGAAPLTVNFINTSTGSYFVQLWDFNGDGITDSTSMNPSHTYTSAGTYSVSLIVANSSGSSSKTRTAYITVT